MHSQTPSLSRSSSRRAPEPRAKAPHGQKRPSSTVGERPEESLKDREDDTSQQPARSVTADALALPFWIFTLAAPLLMMAGCERDLLDDHRAGYVVNSLVADNHAHLRARSALMVGKFEQMAASEYSFFRGTAGLWLRDIQEGGLPISETAFTVPEVMPWSPGDPHPENFGSMWGSDEQMTLEVNDLDAADRHPYHLDLRRLAVGIALAVRQSNGEAGEAYDRAQEGEAGIVSSAVASYFDTLFRTRPEGVFLCTDGPGITPNIQQTLCDEGQAEVSNRGELATFTQLTGETRRLRRGNVELDEPWHQVWALPSYAYDAVQDSLDAYRKTLHSPPSADFFTVLDAGRHLGVGVSSWSRIRLLVLVRGLTDSPADDVLLELKELGDSGSPGWHPKGVFSKTVQRRIRDAQAWLWSRSDADPYWGTGAWLGLPVQIRSKRAAHQTIRVRKLTGDMGGVEELELLAVLLGHRLAVMHMRSDSVTSALRSALEGQREAFISEHASAAQQYATIVQDDYQRFKDALARLGPTLGIIPRLEDQAPVDIQVLLGVRRLSKELP